MRRCNLCGSTRNLTQHHVGSRNCIAWFTMSLCADCQVVFHARQQGAGIDLRFTANATVRLIRAMKMTILFLWMLLDMLEREIETGNEK
jgi:hypothetical protein